MQDLDEEKKWHEQKFYIDSGHWTSHPLFASRERHWLKNDMQKNRFYGYLYKFLRNTHYLNDVNLLIAPVGDGSDYKYLQGIANNIYGIDISSIALSNCPQKIIAKEADILSSGYDDESFDIIICSLFLHHVHKIGFEPFVNEFYRLLRRGGTLAIMEPSSMYPLRFVFALLNRIIGNVTGKVEGEKPILPLILLKVLKLNGFQHIRTIGLTYNHVRFPVFLQLITSFVDYPFRHYWPFCYFAETLGIFCQKS